MPHVWTLCPVPLGLLVSREARQGSEGGGPAKQGITSTHGATRLLGKPTDSLTDQHVGEAVRFVAGQGLRANIGSDQLAGVNGPVVVHLQAQ